MDGIMKQTALGEPLNRQTPSAKVPLLRQPLAALRLGRRRVKGLRQHYNLIIETHNNLLLGWAEASYVSFPLVDILRFSCKVLAWGHISMRAYNSLVNWTARRSRTALS